MLVLLFTHAFDLCAPKVCLLFLTSTDLIKNTKAIIFLSNSQNLLTNWWNCDKIYSSHELNIFIPKTGKYFGKKCFLSFLIPLLGSNSCDNN